MKDLIFRQKWIGRYGATREFWKVAENLPDSVDTASIRFEASGLDHPTHDLETSTQITSRPPWFLGTNAPNRQCGRYQETVGAISIPEGPGIILLEHRRDAPLGS